jgi:hypothetical protein
VYRALDSLDVRGRARPLSYTEYDLVRAAHERAGPRGLVLPIVDDIGDGYGVLEFLANRRRWGARLSTWRSRLWLVKPIRPRVVSEPICARSDDAALFELLYQVGGRMPAPE